MRLAVGGALLLNIGIVVGCGYAEIDVGLSCPGYDKRHVDPISGLPDPCHERYRDAGIDAGDVDAGEGDVANAGCPGECVPQGYLGWSNTPYLVWIGPKGQAPAECPERAWQHVFHGYGSPVAPVSACDGC